MIVSIPHIAARTTHACIRRSASTVRKSLKTLVITTLRAIQDVVPIIFARTSSTAIRLVIQMETVTSQDAAVRVTVHMMSSVLETRSLMTPAMRILSV